MPEKNKYRHELKYLISEGQLVILKQRLKGLMCPDPHASAPGCYSVHSLYFDDLDDRCYFENLSGTEPREKFRLRFYDRDTEHIRLECKRKEHGMTLKTSCPVTPEQCERLMRGETLPDTDSLPPVLRKLTLAMRLAAMRPAVIVRYERFPYIYPLGNVRVTLDTKLSSSKDTLRFLADDTPKRPVIPTGQNLLEVKYDSFLPDVLYRAMQLDDLMQTAYSKYALCRKYSL